MQPERTSSLSVFARCRWRRQACCEKKKIFNEIYAIKGVFIIALFSLVSAEKDLFPAVETRRDVQEDKCFICNTSLKLG